MVKHYNEDIFVNSETQDFKSLLRSDNEFFNEKDSNIIHSIINVKRIKLPKNGEYWEILVNGKVTLLMKSTRFTNQEKEFLRSIEGMKWLITEYKNGKKSVVKIKEVLRKIFP